MHDTQGTNPTVQGAMTEADCLHDCLCSSKERALLYARAALESTNNGVREFFLAMHGEETHNQEIVFSFLHTRGFYPVEMASPERIASAERYYRSVHDQIGLAAPPSGRCYHTADPRMHPAQTQNPEHFELHNRH